MTAPGPIGDEARALVEAAREWAARTFPDVDAHLATGSAECQWCPVCRAAAALRTPELTGRIAGAVTVAAGALASVLDALTRPAPAGAPGSGAPGSGAPGSGAPGSGSAVGDGSYPGPVDIPINGLGDSSYAAPVDGPVVGPNDGSDGGGP